MSRPRRRNITHIHNTYPQVSSVKTSALWVAYVCMVIWMGLYFLQRAEIRNLGELVRVQNETILLSQVRAERYQNAASEALRRFANDTPETDSGMIRRNFLVSPIPDQMTGQNGAIYIGSSAWSPNCTALRTFHPAQDEMLVGSYQDADGRDCEVYRNDREGEHTICFGNISIQEGVVGRILENERIATVADRKQP